jgi:CheY-like chemotaxis protein
MTIHVVLKGGLLRCFLSLAIFVRITPFPTEIMKQFKCLVLEDSLNDQLSIEMLLIQYPEITPIYVSSSEEFQHEIATNHFNLIISDIRLKGTLTGIDLIQWVKDTSIWIIICSAYNSETYNEQYKLLPFTKFYLQKPFDDFAFKKHIESFLCAKK